MKKKRTNKSKYNNTYNIKFFVAASADLAFSSYELGKKKELKPDRSF